MTKIYAQGNYIVIEANNERKTFQKKGVGFEIVNDDGLYSLNYKGIPIGYFNYSDVKKEDGSDYATPLEFETFLFENTGNFNSGADVSPNYIPLTGTEVSFTNDRIYGSLASPETANITANITNAKLGVTNIIIHNSGTVPTFDSQFKKLSGSGSYVVGVVNYIYCTFITDTEIIYSINQRS